MLNLTCDLILFHGDRLITIGNKFIGIVNLIQIVIWNRTLVMDGRIKVYKCCIVYFFNRFSNALFLFSSAQRLNSPHSSRAFSSNKSCMVAFGGFIPPIGTNGQQAWRLGPSGQKNQFFDFGPYNKWRWRAKNVILYFNFTGAKN